MKTFNLIFVLGLLLSVSSAQSKPLNLETSTDPHPKLTNAKLQTLDASSGLRTVVDGLLKQQGPLWFAYLIPTQRKERTMCCFDSWEGSRKDGCCGGCNLEHSNSSFNGTMKG